MVFSHSARGSAPLLPTFFLGPPGVPKSSKNALKRTWCLECAHRWPQRCHLGCARDAKVLHTPAKSAQKCPFGVPGVAQTLQKWCFTMGKHAFSQNQQIHTFHNFWHHLCSRGPPKWCKRWPGGGTGAPGGATRTPRVPKSVQKGYQK